MVLNVSSTESMMLAAIREAERGIGQTSPNPSVGAVIVRDDQIISRGWHKKAGEPHAEVEAIRGLPSPELSKGATLFVTLEPCSTHGRTPPCVETIIRGKFKRVVIGTLDPNPAHAGKALSILNSAGIETEHGVLEEQCRRLNLAFNKWIVTKMPFVIAKAGMTLDGRLTRPHHEPRWITNEASRHDTHLLRSRVDAILVGGETVRVDDPELTVRGIPGARQPYRIVVTQSGNLPPAARILTDAYKDRTCVFVGRSLRKVLEDLGQKEITSVMIEGGMRTLGEAFDQQLVDQVCFYVAPLLGGGPKLVVGGLGAGSTAESPQLMNVEYRRFGDDLRMTGDVKYAATIA